MRKRKRRFDMLVHQRGHQPEKKNTILSIIIEP